MARRTQCLVVLVTCPTRHVATRLATTLVRARLAACVNLVSGVSSLFWWQGRVDRAREILLMIKTTARRFEALRRAVQQLHPYDVPEIISLPIGQGHPAYLAWIAESVSHK